MITKFKIYGERCSGTNYLHNLMLQNFDIEANQCDQLGFKHFFGFQDRALRCNNYDDTLFICIIRHPVDWINSLSRTPWHIPWTITRNLDTFLSFEIYSVSDPPLLGANPRGKENLMDRNIYTNNRYKNIFELRHTKLKWMLEDLPKKVKHCILVKYEDLITDFNNTMLKIRDTGLRVKSDIDFPINSNLYKDSKIIKYKKKPNRIRSEIILRHPNYLLYSFYEKELYGV